MHQGIQVCTPKILVGFMSKCEIDNSRLFCG